MRLWAVPLVIGVGAGLFTGPVVGLLSIIVALMIYPQFLDWKRTRQNQQDEHNLLARQVAQVIYRSRSGWDFSEEDLVRRMTEEAKAHSAKHAARKAFIWGMIVLVVFFLLFGGWR